MRRGSFNYQWLSNRLEKSGHPLGEFSVPEAIVEEPE
jgi:hypothetical protein